MNWLLFTPSVFSSLRWITVIGLIPRGIPAPVFPTPMAPVTVGISPFRVSLGGPTTRIWCLSSSFPTLGGTGLSWSFLLLSALGNGRRAGGEGSNGFWLLDVFSASPPWELFLGGGDFGSAGVRRFGTQVGLNSLLSFSTRSWGSSRSSFSFFSSGLEPGEIARRLFFRSELSCLLFRDLSRGDLERETEGVFPLPRKSTRGGVGSLDLSFESAVSGRRLLSRDLLPSLADLPLSLVPSPSRLSTSPRRVQALSYALSRRIKKVSPAVRRDEENLGSKGPKDPRKTFTGPLKVFLSEVCIPGYSGNRKAESTQTRQAPSLSTSSAYSVGTGSWEKTKPRFEQKRPSVRKS